MSTTFVAMALHNSEERDRRIAFDSSASLLSLQLSSELERYVDATYSLAAALGSHETLYLHDFDAVTEPLPSEQLNGIESVALVVKTSDASVAATQTYWRNQGEPKLSLHPASGLDTHYFPVFTRSLSDDITATPSVDDLAPYPEVVTAIEASLRTGQVHVSRGMPSHRDVPLFAQDQQPVFVMAAPSYGPSGGQPRVLKGWVVVGLRAQDLANQAFAKSDVRLFDNAKVTGLLANGRPVLVSQLSTTNPERATRMSRSIVVAQDLWSVEVTKATDIPFFDGGRPLLSALVFVSGVIATLSLGSLVFVLAAGRSRALQLVASRTKDLQRDIERRERVEKDLKAAQAISEEQRADLSAFAGFAAHDLKAPLTLIAGYLELIRSGLQDSSADKSELPEFARRAIRASARMRSLVDSLLMFARTREAKISPVAIPLEDALRAVIDEIFEQQRAEGIETHQSSVSLSGPFPTVCVDEAMLHQLLENVIGNAFKYVRPGQSPQIEISARSLENEMTELAVADRGIGIPDDRKEAVFGGFVRADNSEGYAGSGLGLAIVKRIVERHGGTIGVEDNLGGGTRFVITLPEFPSEPQA